MSYLALARRYRPGDFEHIISQNHITNTLKNAVSSGRISHAYLFCGPRGTGKTTTARVLARALNCEKGPTPAPCGECTVCVEIVKGSSPDVFEIDAASNRGIDDIRELRENVRYSPVGGRYKIYIIDEVHRLTREAFDALLKTLEEPPAHVIFIFATTEPQALPATILSRTQRYDFKRIPVSSLAESVNSIAQKEGLTIEADAALMIAKKADGSLRDALSLLDQLSSITESKIDSAAAAEILGLVKTEVLYNISEALIRHDSKSALTQFGAFVKSGGDPLEFADALIGYIRTLLLIKNGVNDSEILELDKSEIDKAAELLEDIESVDLLRFFTVLADYKAAAKLGQDPMFSLEAALVKLANLDRALNIEAFLNSQSPGQQSAPPARSTENRSKGETVGRPTVPRPSPPKQQNSVPPPSPPPDIEDDFLPPARDGSLSIGAIIEGWDGFRKYVFRDNKAVFGHLGFCRPSKLDNTLLMVEVQSPVTFQFEQLSKADTKASLELALCKYYSSELKLKLVQGTAANSAGNASADLQNPEKIFDGSPGMKNLFDIMGGEILGQ